MPPFSPTITTTSTPTHQAKRPYAGTHSQTQHQTAITSYFQAFPPTSRTTSHSPSIDSTPVSPPALPPLVQSNLLSVGMRVRKSVPEGYKTGNPKKNTYSSFNLPQDSNVLHSQSMPQATGSNTTTAISPTTSSRELTPFCGIMKVGGLAVQGCAWDSVRSDEIEEEEEAPPREEDVPFLSSQASTISSIFSMDPRPANSNKRRFEEGADDEQQQQQEQSDVGFYDIWRDKNDDDDLQLSPKSRPEDLMPRLGLGMGRSARAVAVPKSRRKGSGNDRGGADVKVAVMEGQENHRHVVEVDFGEAEFMDWSSCVG